MGSDEVEAHRLGQGGFGNTNEAAEDDEVEAHARYAGNSNETVEDDGEDEVEAHIADEDADDDDFDD